MNQRIKSLCYTALLIDIGILLPQMFHAFGGAKAGGMFLPMHLPILLAGFLLGPYAGMITGLFTPILSSFLLGMPMLEKLPFMVIELFLYGFMSGLLSKTKCNLWLQLLLTLLVARIAYGIILAICLYLFRVNVSPLLSIYTALLTGIPGIVMQIILVPLLVISLRKVIFRASKCHLHS